MDNNGLSLFAILFLVFLGLSAALIIWMFVSLVHLGDERRQQIVGKACTLSFSGLVGYFLLRTLVFMLGDGKELLHPLKTPTAPHPRRTFVVKDIRLFLNTLDRGMALMRSAGVAAKCQREDHEDEICLTIRIPRSVSH